MKQPQDGAPTPFQDDAILPHAISYADAVFAMEQSDENDAFALWCHLADLNDIRMFVKGTWKEYAAGKLTLDVAGMITETAFGMMKRAHEEFIAVKPRFIAHDDISLFLGLKVAFNNNLVYTFSRNPLAKAADVLSETKQADLVCAGARLHLGMFSEACEKSLRDDLQYATDFSTQCYPGNLTGSGPKTEFEAQSFSFVPELTALVPGQRGFGNRKEKKHYYTHLTEGLTTLVPLNSERIEAPTWLVVATQTCMDIRDTVDITCGPATLHRSAAAFERVAEHYHSFHQLPHFVDVSAVANQETLHHMSSQWNKVKSAVTLGELGSSALNAAFQDRLYFPGLRMLPGFAGELTYSMKIRLHKLGTSVANDCDAVMIIAHLYKAGERARSNAKVPQQ